MSKLYIGIDVGGTFIKSGIIDSNNNIITKMKIETSKVKVGENSVQSIFEIIKGLLSNSNISLNEISGIGIGISGIMDSKNGFILESNVLMVKNYPLAKELEKLTKIPVKLANDADVATLSEQKIGAGKDYKNFIMLTIGTGIGGGAVLNGINMGIEYGLPLEFGHMKGETINPKIHCNCGRVNCYEKISTPKFLVQQTLLEIQNYTDSDIYKLLNSKELSSEIIFEHLEDDIISKIFKNFIKNLGDGIVNLVNIFKPEVIIIGGGISNQNEKLTKPLEHYVNKHTILNQIGYNAKIIPAKFTNGAGIIGAKLLFN